ncbi:MAG: RNA polymerase sigma factor [Actinobacteria bacterium]|nr:RNA polymerase sigma factor [Actinomycetota bacterium]
MGQYPGVSSGSDADIISSAAPTAALALLFERHFAAVYRYLSRRVGPQLAEELAAETFVQALTHLAAYDRTRPDARPWLFGIATNLLRHHVRSERRRLAAYRRAAVEVGASLIEEDAGMGLLGPKLLGEIRTMSAEQRDVLLLYAWAALSYEQIADALGLPIGTVRSRLSRTRQRLRELMEVDRATTARGSTGGVDDDR